MRSSNDSGGGGSTRISLTGTPPGLIMGESRLNLKSGQRYHKSLATGGSTPMSHQRDGQSP